MTSGAWQQTDLLEALGMVEPFLANAASKVAEDNSPGEPGDIDEPRGENEPAPKGTLPVAFGEPTHSPRGPSPFAVVPVALDDAASEDNGAGQQVDGAAIAGGSVVVATATPAPCTDPTVSSLADGADPPNALKRRVASSLVSEPPVPPGSTSVGVLPTESALANTWIGIASPAELVSPAASSQLGSERWAGVLDLGRPENWCAPQSDSFPSVPPQQPLRCVGVGSADTSTAGATAGLAADALEPSDPLPAPPETLLILDTETTALRPEEGQCIEVGAVLFHVPHRAVLTQVSFLLACDRNPAETVNGIPAAVTRLPQPWQAALACFEVMLEQADAVLAHNASFDRQWFGRGHLPPIVLPWICSMEDIRWPNSLGLRPAPSLQALALAHGVPVWAAHRALTDCTYLVQVLQRCDELELLLAAALEPRSLMRAGVSYADRHLAREAGFRWDQSVARAWTRRLSQREAISLPFPVYPVEADQHLGQAC